MKLKKSQMEILGLAIVVLFIVLIMGFVISFIVMKSPEQHRKSYKNEQLAINTVSAVLETNTDCNDQSIAALLRDCAEYNPGSLYCGIQSCVYAKTTIKSIFEKTLNKWNTNYNFVVFISEGSNIMEISNDEACNESNTPDFEKETGNFKIPTYVGTLNVFIGVC